jgi:hypothetical protein
LWDVQKLIIVWKLRHVGRRQVWSNGEGWRRIHCTDVIFPTIIYSFKFLINHIISPFFYTHNTVLLVQLEVITAQRALHAFGLSATNTKGGGLGRSNAPGA